MGAKIGKLLVNKICFKKRLSHRPCKKGISYNSKNVNKYKTNLTLS